MRPPGTAGTDYAQNARPRPVIVCKQHQVYYHVDCIQLPVPSTLKENEKKTLNYRYNVLCRHKYATLWHSLKERKNVTRIKMTETDTLIYCPTVRGSMIWWINLYSCILVFLYTTIFHDTLRFTFFKKFIAQIWLFYQCDQ